MITDFFFFFNMPLREQEMCLAPNAYLYSCNKGALLVQPPSLSYWKQNAISVLLLN